LCGVGGIGILYRTLLVTNPRVGPLALRIVQTNSKNGVRTRLAPASALCRHPYARGHLSAFGLAVRGHGLTRFFYARLVIGAGPHIPLTETVLNALHGIVVQTRLNDAPYRESTSFPLTIGISGFVSIALIRRGKATTLLSAFALRKNPLANWRGHNAVSGFCKQTLGRATHGIGVNIPHAANVLLTRSLVGVVAHLAVTFLTCAVPDTAVRVVEGGAVA